MGKNRTTSSRVDGGFFEGPSATPSDIESWLDDCESAVGVPRSAGGPGYNDWEEEFLESIREQVDEGRDLTERQIDKLRDLWERV